MGQPDRPINFSVLQRLDEEVDGLIREGRWTREEFERLWQAGLEASGGDESWLEFLSCPADPEWLPETPGARATGLGYERVWRQVTELIHRLQRGWSPRWVLSPAGAVWWNDKPLLSARAYVTCAAGHARVALTCSPDHAKSLMAEMDTYVSGSIIRNTLRTEHAGCWRFESDNANIESIGSRLWPRPDAPHRILLRAIAWRARKGDELPLLWLSPLTKPMTVRLGNLCVIGNPQHIPLPPGFSRYYPGWTMGNWRLHGEFTYYLVKVRDRSTQRQYLIVEPNEPGEIDLNVFHRDMTALQFIMGEALQCPVIYGIRGPEIVACMQTIHHKDVPGTRTPAISDHLEHFEYWIEPFFSKLSRALREQTTSKLNAVEASLESRHGSIDRQVLELVTALLGLAFWTLHADGHAQIEGFQTADAWAPRQRIERALDTLGIQLPDETLDEIELYERRLRSLGSLTETIDRSNEEYEREGRLVDTLRTVLVAMVAATVGYRGVIRGVGYDEGPPEWWVVNAEEEQGIYHYYVAVSAPAPAIIPSLAPGEVLLVVEHRHHQTIINELLRAAGLPASRVRILIGEGRNGLRDIAQAAETSPMAILAASKRRSIPIAVEELRQELGIDEGKTVLCAIPDVDAWLLADDELLRRRVDGDSELLAELDAMPLPEEVSDPFELTHRILGPPEGWGILRDTNIYRACVRSPSLRHFLSWMAQALGVQLDLPVESAGRTISRDAIAGLIREMMPGDVVAWKTSDGHTYTADDISREVEQGSDIGHQYARNVLRVAIDSLRRQARSRRNA